jgi:hypothetical protein
MSIRRLPTTLTRRLKFSGLALVAVLALASTGCDDATSTGSNAAVDTSASNSSTPTEELLAATGKLGETSVVATLRTGDLEGSGVIDPTAGKAKMVMSMGPGDQALKVEAILVDNEIFFKTAAVPGLPDKWMRIAADQIKPGSSLNLISGDDPAGVRAMAETAIDVQRDGDRGFKGTLDLSKSPMLDVDALEAGDKVKSVPFTAKVDEEGRLVEFTVDMKVLLSTMEPMVFTYSDFGVTVDVRKPAADEVVDVPETLLNVFNG